VRDHHATLFLPPGEARDEVEAVRRAWDPAMAEAIGAHVTALYPVEAPSPEALLARVEAVTAKTAPLPLTLGGYALFPPPYDGAYREVGDDRGGFAALRRALTGAPFRAEDVPPHVTVVHPRTSDRTAAFWAARPASPPMATVWFEAVDVTAFDGVRWVSVARFRLAGDGGSIGVD
jgi:2'-5' RNA ligase